MANTSYTMDKPIMYQSVKTLKHMTVSKINNGYILQVEYEGNSLSDRLSLSFPTIDAVLAHIQNVDVTLEKDLLTQYSFRITELQKRIEVLENASKPRECSVLQHQEAGDETK